MRIAHGALFGIACLLAWSVGPASPAFRLSDLRKIVSLSDPQISPDGKEIAVIVSTPDWKTDAAAHRIDLVDVASAARHTLIRKRESLSSPRWSPDGTRLAFLAKDARSKKVQIFVTSIKRRGTRRVTDNLQGVDEYSWSPDGKSIAFVAQDPPHNATAIAAHNKVFEVTDGHFLLTEAVAPWQLWVVSSAGGNARQLTEGDFSLGTDEGSATTPAWNRDGRHIAFTKFPGVHWASSFHSVIAEVDISNGEMQTLVFAETSDDFKFSPAGDVYAFLRPRGGDQNNGDGVYVHTNDKTWDSTAAMARHFRNYAWMPDGQSLITSGELGTHSVLWQQPLSGKARLLDLGEVEANDGLGTTTSADATSVSISRSGAIAFIGSTANHPSELYVLDSVNARPRRLTDVNAFIDTLELGRTESIE